MLPLRIVLDTNVVVSAVMYPEGLQGDAFALSMTKPARLYVSQPVLDEYFDVLYRPRLPIRKGVRVKTVQVLKARSYLVSPAYRIDAARDPADNIFLECADKAGADYLVTGNLKHFPTFWKKTKIISTREFLSLVAPHLGERRRL